jgi:hypothetical protein
MNKFGSTWNLNFGGHPMFAGESSSFGSAWTTEQVSSFLILTDNQDMEAINHFISDTVAVTPEAVKLKDAWIKWFDNLGWWEKNIGTPAYDEARNRRNAFIIANQPNATAKKEMQEQLKRGIETEEMSPDDFWTLTPGDSGGQATRKDSSGNLPEPPPEPLIPTWAKGGMIIAIIGGVALGVAKLVGSLNPAALALKFAKKKGQ